MPKQYVTAYEVTRHYGGPEEGGWWYDWQTPLETVPVNNSDEREAALEQLNEAYSHVVYGDRFSVRGGADLVVLVEDHPEEFASRERPFYE